MNGTTHSRSREQEGIEQTGRITAEILRTERGIIGHRYHVAGETYDSLEDARDAALGGVGE